MHENQENILKCLRQWNATPLENPYRLKGKVVRGDQIARNLLKLRTANLSLSEAHLESESEQEILKNHLMTGIFQGNARIHPQTDKMKSQPSMSPHIQQHNCLISLGQNPSHEEKGMQIKLEAHLYHDFSDIDDFQGEDLVISFSHYIRPEADVSDFNQLLQLSQHHQLRLGPLLIPEQLYIVNYYAYRHTIQYYAYLLNRIYG